MVVSQLTEKESVIRHGSPVYIPCACPPGTFFRSSARLLRRPILWAFAPASSAVGVARGVAADVRAVSRRNWFDSR